MVKRQKKAATFKYAPGDQATVGPALLDAGTRVVIDQQVPGVAQPGYIVHPVGRDRCFFWVRECELEA